MQYTICLLRRVYIRINKRELVFLISCPKKMQLNGRFRFVSCVFFFAFNRGTRTEDEKKQETE